MYLSKETSKHVWTTGSDALGAYELAPGFSPLQNPSVSQEVKRTNTKWVAARGDGIHVTPLSANSKLFLSTNGLLGIPQSVFQRWLNNG